MKTIQKVGVLMMILPVIIAFVLFLFNLPNSFDHCWIGDGDGLGLCGLDLIFGIIGVISIVIGYAILMNTSIEESKKDD